MKKLFNKTQNKIREMDDFTFGLYSLFVIFICVTSASIATVIELKLQLIYTQKELAKYVETSVYSNTYFTVTSVIEIISLLMIIVVAITAKQRDKFRSRRKYVGSQRNKRSRNP